MTVVTNYIRNPVFNTSTTDALGIGAAVARVTSQPDLHPTVLRVTPNGGASLQGLQMASAPTLGFTGSERFFVGSFSIIAPYNVRSFIRVNYTDSTFADSPFTTHTTTGGVERIATAVVTTNPAKTVSLFFLQVRTDVNTTTPFHVSRLMVHEGSSPVAYFDGDSPSAAWNGTAHASTSTITLPARLSPVLKIGSSYIGPLRVGKG